MAKTPSTMIPLGTTAPDFTLPDTISGKMVSLQDAAQGKPVVVMFICNHCPYVVHILPRLVEVAQEYKAKGISFVAISSNDVANYPDDSPEKMAELGKAMEFSFPYLYDETQKVAKAYDAACTPDLYVFDKELKCVYRGQFDSSRPKSENPVTGADLCGALDAIVQGQPVPTTQIPSLGCNIKWKAA